MIKNIILLFLFIGSITKAQVIPLTNYDRINSQLPENSVRCITFENDSTAWIGTDAGLAKLEGTTWTIYHPTNSGLPWDDVRAITIDKNNDKWIGTANGGFAQFDGINWTVTNMSNSLLPDDFVRAIAFDSAGVKWIGAGAGGGLSEISTSNKWNIYQMFTSPIGSNTIAAIYIDSSTNDKYVGTVNGGLLIIHDTTFTNYTLQNSGIPDNTILGITKDNVGNIWIASPANGLIVKLPSFGWFNYSPFNSSISSYGLSSIDIDANQDLWIGSIDSGLIKKSGQSFRNFSTVNTTLIDNHVQCVRVAPDGKIWFGTSADGVYILDPALLTSVKSIEVPSLISIFPNPTNKGFTYLKSSQLCLNIKLYDLNGKEILQQEVNDYFVKINLENVKKGNYFLIINYANGKTVNKKIIVE